MLKLKNVAYLHVLLDTVCCGLDYAHVLRVVGMMAVEASSFLLIVAFPTISLCYMQNNANCLSLGKITTHNILGN